MTNNINYQEESQKILKRIRELLKDENWQTCRDQKEIKVSVKSSEDFHGNVFKAEYYVQGKSENVLEIIKCIDKQVKWNSSVKELIQVEKLTENLEITRVVSHSFMMGLISSRDFIDLLGIQKYPGENLTLLYWAGVKNDKKLIPPAKGCVRACNYPSGLAIYKDKNDPEKSRVVAFLQCDIHLSPRTLVDKVLPLTLSNYANDLQKGLKTLL